MSRAERLLDLLQSLRRRRYAVRGRDLAEELGISLRTLYRDIATLQAQGASIEGEAGIGFILRPGYTLPPLMFTPEEIEAMVLGARWVIDRADECLAIAARNALSKIGAVVPPNLKESLETGTLLVPTQSRPAVDGKFIECIRKAIREETKMALTYRDLSDQLTQRVVWPFALAFFDQALIVVAWCEMRRDFRHFRADRVESWNETKTNYPRGRLALLREWQEKEGIPRHKYDL
ncbi:MAG: YafY family protein [Syntrophorhabdales bacterium]|jgi:predicted DNA-binding transcriptional regulator YafY